VNQQSTILNELRELSPTLASIPRVNVFKVPDGYFETLPALLLLQTGNKESADIKSGSVPEGYFDSLAASIMARIKGESVAPFTETEESVVLAGIGNKNVFTVPQGYFDGLATAVFSRVNTESIESTVLAGIGNTNVFTVPLGYFEGLAGNVMARINSENNNVQHETSEISTLVANIGNKNVFTVPHGYFEQLADTITITKQTAPAKVIRMNIRRTLLKYAAAAVVTGFIAISAFFVLNQDKSPLSSDNLAAIKKADAIIKTNSFDKELASISDADIVNFLESKGQDVDAALVASLTDNDKALPEADDYLFDENTLDEVLKDLDLNN
jgi:hypothetical protein